MKIGVLTGGGDCPGLNAVIRAVTKQSLKRGHQVLGIRNGWVGLVDGQVEPLASISVSGILPKGGTILGTSRTNPYKNPELAEKCRSNFKKFGLDALIVIGDLETLEVARRLFDDGVPTVGVPKTIDNDMPGTDQSFGFDTAVNTVTEAIDRLHSTAEAHHRAMVVEVMGGRSGWIAAMAGLAGGADFIVVPEKPYDLDEIAAALMSRRERGSDFSIVVVAEGARPKEGETTTSEGNIGYLIARELERRTGIETRVTILGHVQRGGSPTAFDRVLATRCGLRAADLVHEKKFGRMVSFQGFRVIDVPYPELGSGGKSRSLDMELYHDAEVFFG